jgi:hypothetical protein
MFKVPLSDGVDMTPIRVVLSLSSTTPKSLPVVMPYKKIPYFFFSDMSGKKASIKKRSLI